MKELWGIMNVLDSADDVALFVVSGRDAKILYCNHYVTVVTNAHAGSDVSKVWDPSDFRKAVERCNAGGTYRYIVERSPFGKRQNVTVGKVVWSQGVLAYYFLLTFHVDDEEEEERDRIFHILGQSYDHVFLIGIRKGEVTTLLKGDRNEDEGHYRAVYYHPVSYDEWRHEIIESLSHPDDIEELSQYLDPIHVMDGLTKGDYAFQYRKRCKEGYRWYELRFQRLDELEGKIVCTERDVEGEISLSERERRNEVILRSISNSYRSIYLLDLATGEYTTVKPDRLLFGIPNEGAYDVMMTIVAELIPDEKQKNDFRQMFSIEALSEAFGAEAENISRDYESALDETKSWMSVTAFKPPYMQGMENKCVLTFLDVTEHKRIEAERNEKNIVIDILSSRYIAVFFIEMSDGSFHSITIPLAYRYIEKQFKDIRTAMLHYAKAYVLEQYRDIFTDQITPEKIRAMDAGKAMKLEYIYRTVEDRWLRLHIFPVMEDGTMKETILAFEDYGDVMVQRELGMIYNATMLSDYDYMYEYEPESDSIYTLSFDGEQLGREKKQVKGLHSEEFRKEILVHPDDLPVLLQACDLETIRESMANGKTVTHLFLRMEVEGEYRLFMYSFHYFRFMDKLRVLVMARDSEREIL